MSRFTHLLAAFAAALILSVVGSSQDRAQARAEVSFAGYPVGTVVVKTGQRRLYLVVRDGRAIVYPVGVGRASKQWTGTVLYRRQAHQAGMVAACRRQEGQSEGCPT